MGWKNAGSSVVAHISVVRRALSVDDRYPALFKYILVSGKLYRWQGNYTDDDHSRIKKNYSKLLYI